MKIKIAFVILALSSLACLETVPQSARPAEATPLDTQSAIQVQEPGQEPESGAVYEIPTQGSKQTCAIVTAVQSLNLRQAPSEKSSVISWLPANKIVRVIGTVGEWWKVEADGFDGYANADYLQETECR